MSEQESAGAAPAAADAVDTEISLKAALERLLTDDSLADVTLKGNDGVEVPVNKGLLAARSEVFRALLYGNFAEGGESTVSIGYTGSVLKAVVDYIYTDRLTFLVSAGDARTAAAIMEAANYFHLPGMCEKAKEIATEEMKSNPSIAFEYLSAGTELNVIDMEQSAMMCLRKSLPEIMGMEGAGESIQALAPPVVGRILRDEDIQADEKTLFLLLKRWSDSGEDFGGRSRKEIASDLISHIRLDQIDPSTLSELVVPTGLVADARLMEIFKAQAILASSQNRGMFNRKRKRGLCCWKQSTLIGQEETTLILGEDRMTPAVQCFDTPELTSGLHRWSIKVIEESCNIFLGVVCPVLAPARIMEADGSIAWTEFRDAAFFISSYGTGHHGNRVYNNNQIFPAFSEGSIVKCSLDLRQESRGKLSVSVGEGQERVVFDNMKTLSMNNGLLPAIWANGPSKFEILSMESEE